jgi:hypothetical protein
MSQLDIKENRGRYQNGIFILLSLPMMVLMCCGVAFWLPQILNDWQLARFAENLYRYPLPPQTEVLSRHSEVGLMGNGNHCDFLVTQTMLTRLTREEIKIYYKNVAFPPVNDHNEGVSLPYQGKPIPVYLEFDMSVETAQQRFTARLIDMGYNPGLDIRCH